MKAYLSISYSRRRAFNSEVNSILEVLKKFEIDPFVFVDLYKFSPDQEKQMMQQAMADIDSCDILLAEVSDKGIGIGVEVGYAKAKNKPVIYLRNKNAEHSTTVSGISDFRVVYEDVEDLEKKLREVLIKIKLRP